MLFLNCCPHLFSPALPANILMLSYLGGQRKNSGQLHILYIDPWWGSPHTCHYFTFVHFLPLPSLPSTKGVQKFHIMFTPGLAILNKRREHCMQLHSRVLHENTCFGNSRCVKWILGPWVNRIKMSENALFPNISPSLRTGPPPFLLNICLEDLPTCIIAISAAFICLSCFKVLPRPEVRWTCDDNF